MSTSLQVGSLPDPLFHYTTLGGLHGIITTKRLRATSIRHLNDASEFKYAHSVVWDALERVTRGQAADIVTTVMLLQNAIDFRRIETALAFTEATDLTFVTSFSANGNQLSQWRAYSQGGGYALGFSGGELQKIAAEQGFELVACSYDTNEHRRTAEKLAYDLVQQVAQLPADLRTQVPAEANRTPAAVAPALFPIARHLRDELQRFAPFWKHHSFREEAEWRLVSRKRRDAVSFRVGHSQIVPYTEVMLDTPVNRPGEVVTVLRETIVGPCSDPELAAASALILLRSHGFVASLSVPENPLRDW